MIERCTILAVVATLVACSKPPPAPSAATAPTAEAPETPTALPSSAPMSVDEFLKALPDLVAQDASLARARAAAKATIGVEVESARDLDFALTPPLDAKHVATLLGVKGELYIVSGDVHQRSWRLEIGGERLADPHNHRIAADVPKLGAWQLDITISGRPSGPLPKIVTGASPAYPLAGRTARVTNIRLWS